MTQRRVRVISASDLRALSTARLLAYRSKLLELADSAALADLDIDDFATLDRSFVYFEDQTEWRQLYTSVKRILGDREHVERRR